MEMVDEEWFFESISRYKNLNMFELEQPVQQVEPAGPNSICVACSNSKRHQLLELSLPSKLLSQTKESSDNTITSDTDLKIKCGTFTESMCFQIKVIDEHKVIVSHEDTKGVTLYRLSSDSDEINKEITTGIDCKFVSPMIATNGSLMWLTRKRADQMLLYDINTGFNVHGILVDERNTAFECDERIVPMFLGPDVVAFGYQTTGGIYFADHRVPLGWTYDGPCYDENCRNDHDFWSFTTLHECSKEFSSEQNTCFAQVSKTGTLLVYDRRNTRLPAYVDKNIGLKNTKDTPLQIQFRPGNKDWISVSGFDRNVYVYQLSKGEDPKLVFTHDGHKHVEGYDSQTEVTSHVWSSRLDNLVISSADNGTVQMWQFENK